MRRVLANDAIIEHYRVNREEVLASREKQEELWTLIFPPQVDTGKSKSSTFKWILSRTRDGSQASAPREIIHLLNELRDRQINRIERGERRPPEMRLFEQVCFKEALPEVSRVRLKQTLYAEYAEQKKWIELLDNKKATQSSTSLAGIWGVEEGDAAVIAQELERIGFFEKMSKGWRVPFIYRPALNLTQGSA